MRAMTTHHTPEMPEGIQHKLALSVGEAAYLLSMSPSSVRRLIADGILPRVQHTERVLIPRLALETYVNGAAA